MQTAEQIQTEWSKSWSYHLIGLGLQLREMLLEQCGQEWLEQHRAYIVDKDSPLQSAHVEAWFHTEDDRAFDIRNIGYTERPIWHISGRNKQGNWFHVETRSSNLKEVLEYLFQV